MRKVLASHTPRPGALGVVAGGFVGLAALGAAQAGLGAERAALLGLAVSSGVWLAWTGVASVVSTLATLPDTLPQPASAAAVRGGAPAALAEGGVDARMELPPFADTQATWMPAAEVDGAEPVAAPDVLLA